MELLSKERVEQLKFIDQTSSTRTEGVEYVHEPFHIVLFEDDAEHPEISMVVANTQVFFPGAYTLKDLKDLMFFYYGENEYTERFGHLPIEIIE